MGRVDWRKRVTQPPFVTGKPPIRHPRGDSRRAPEQKREDEARRAAETAERHANYDATSHAQHNTSPWTLSNPEVSGASQKAPRGDTHKGSFRNQVA